ncbi:DNA cytosine methyltransferase [Aerosakkonema sp. BLCC-F183]|uniref:DNA cytosine methyltransferase n=1 Tax=Aerosakkonema sp. BLCC-F183 TaxID=3342834 RepID=UPI0035BB6FD4
MRPTAIDLFCGAGGLSLGLEQAGFDVVAAVDVDRINCQTHKLNFPHCPAICKDIAELTAAELRQLAGIGDRTINLVAGSPPCQGFSLIGKRRLGDDRNNLVFHFVRLVAELRADYFIMENVPGLMMRSHRKYLDNAIDYLWATGYVVRSPVVLNAADYGVPQNRRRLFLIGSRRGLDLPTYSQVVPKMPPTVWEAIADLPEVTNYPELLERDWLEIQSGQWVTLPGTYAAQLRWDTDKHFGYVRQFNPNLLTNSQRSIHSPKSIARFAATPPGRLEPVSHFHKLNPFGLAPTLRAGTGSDRGNHTAPRPIHPHQRRCITVREGARLHSYPDWFRFHPTILHGFRQVGNSVPPLLARAIASEVIYAMGYFNISHKLSIS